MTLSLSARDLTLRYGAVTALDTLAFTLDEPGVHGLLGRNGSGKTSLLSLVAGLRRPSAGRITIDGEDVFENARAMGRVCLIRESGDMPVDGETVRSVLDFAADMRPRWDEARALELADTFELSLDKKVSALSRGKRAALACTLGIAARAPLTLFDEAYLGMDAPSRYAFYDALLADFMDHPRIIVLSTHLIEEVSKLFERVLIIDDGRLALNENVDTLRGRGVSLTGPAAAVDAAIAGVPVLSSRTLGPTRSVAVYDIPEDARARALEAGLEIGPLPLQDLFIHLTAKEGRK